MKNKDVYFDTILELASKPECIAIERETGIPRNCNDLFCKKCMFFQSNSRICNFKLDELRKWADCEYEYMIDCNELKKDDCIYACGSDGKWYPRHFMKYDNIKERIYFYEEGTTSFTTNGYDCKFNSVPKEYVMLKDDYERMMKNDEYYEENKRDIW